MTAKYDFLIVRNIHLKFSITELKGHKVNSEFLTHTLYYCLYQLNDILHEAQAAIFVWNQWGGPWKENSVRFKHFLDLLVFLFSCHQHHIFFQLIL